MNEMVTITREEYDHLREAAEDLADIRVYDRNKAALVAGEEELIPAEYANRIFNGESAIRVYREFRGLTQSQLADLAGLNRVYLTQIEGGKRNGSIEVIRSIAFNLQVSVDDLI